MGPMTAAFILAYAVLAGYALLVGARWTFAGLSLAVALWLGLPFNPVSQAPTRVEARVPELALEAESRRILVLESTSMAMALLAAGEPVINGVFFYPQQSVWQRMDPSGEASAQYNRYQHWQFEPLPPSRTQSWTVRSPAGRADVVKTALDYTRFDFSRLGAGLVLAPGHRAGELSLNPGLRRLSRVGSWACTCKKTHP